MAVAPSRTLTSPGPGASRSTSSTTRGFWTSYITAALTTAASPFAAADARSSAGPVPLRGPRNESYDRGYGSLPLEGSTRQCRPARSHRAQSPRLRPAGGLFGHPAPNGYGDVRQNWSSTSSMLYRWKLATALTEGELHDDNRRLSDLCRSHDAGRRFGVWPALDRERESWHRPWTRQRHLRARRPGERRASDQQLARPAE